jgi:4'-phosphopantetheinyl transferase
MHVTSVRMSDNLAEHLRDDEIHVWHVPYQRAERRRMLHQVLAGYLALEAADVELVEGAHGRPALAGSLDQSLGFNWSHCGGDALIAIGRHASPGIDLEHLRHRPLMLDRALPETARAPAFLELWTAKEAVLKATGRGIAFGLDRVEISRALGQLSLRRLDGGQVAEWQLVRLSLAPSLVAALAWRGAPRELKLWQLASDGWTAHCLGSPG